MKKKLLFMFVLILAIMSIQIAVFADMDAPQIKSYSFTISNFNGEPYYSYDWETDTLTEVGILNSGDKVEIVFEQIINNEQYGTFYIGEKYNSPSYLVKVSAVENIKMPDVEPTNLEKNKPMKAIVLSEDGLTIYNGPAYGYLKRKTIPKNTEVTLYNDENIGTPWYYIEYEGITGWICMLNGAVGIKDAEIEYYEKDMEMMSYKKLNIYKDTTYTEVVGTIPANTKIENYLEIDAWSMGLYVIHNDIEGYIDSGDYATNIPWMKEKTFEYIVDYPAKIYKEGDFRSEVLAEELPIGTKLEYSYAANTKMTSWKYVTYNGVSGWVFDMSDHVYEDVTYQDVINSYIENYEAEENVENIEKEELADNLEKEDIAVLDENEIEKAEGYIISGTQIVLICVGFAIVLALTVLVTIILVNKNNKKTETKVEDKKEN